MPRIRSRGFTLVEMLVAMTVVGVLAAIGVPRYQSVQRHAQESILRANLRAVREAQEAHLALHGRYAVSVESLELRPSGGVALELASSDPRRSWRAVATHPLAVRGCSTGEGADAPAGAEGRIVCGDGAGGAGQTPTE